MLANEHKTKVTEEVTSFLLTDVILTNALKFTQFIVELHIPIVSPKTGVCRVFAMEAVS